MKNSLAIAYAMKRKKGPPELSNRQPQPPHKEKLESDDIQDDLTPMMKPEFESQDMGDGDSDPWEAEYGSSELGNEDQDQSRKGVLHRIMNKVRMRQMGR